MSSPVPPARPDAASMTAIRGLLERNLIERAVALAETRWPGSGPVVELAHEWTVLSPSARRERLASIGPEELARLRGISQLQPDLARVLDDLEARGIIPPEAAMVADDVAAAPADAVPETFEESVANAAIDYSEQGLQRLAGSVQENLPPHLQASLAESTGGSPDIAEAELAAEAAVAAAAAEAARIRASFDPAEPVEMPALDLGLPSTREFLDQEDERRQEANELANAILERARSRVDESASRLLPAPDSNVPVQTIATAIVKDLPSLPASPPTVSKSEQLQQSTRVDSPVDRSLLARIEREQVVALEPGDSVPSDDDLRTTASATQRDYVVLRPNDIGLRAFFGGLVRQGRQVEPQAGQFPVAVSKPGLVAVYGRLYPKTIERLREGYCDIPGTQATVRVHPDCRIVLLPE
ncbi:MAG TPA: hypothetical protein VEX37_14895 [Thermomicrobiales bacterium]|nr:hypothetical protein [Thermomicrobiales bacterium]